MKVRDVLKRLETGGAKIGHMEFAVVVEKTETGYSAYAPDLPGCVAAGSTASETQQLMREAIELYLEELKTSGSAAPEASTAVPRLLLGTLRS